MYSKENLDKVIYDRFIADFFTCAFKPGDILDPAELSYKYGVSRTPVVQALKRLSNEKIIEVLVNGRFRIPVPTKETLWNICQTRVLFEQEGVRCLIVNRDREQIQVLRSMSEDCLHYIQEANAYDSVKMDMDFHRTLVASAKNSWMGDLYEITLNRFISIKYALTGQYTTQMVGARRHVDLMEQVEAGNLQKARSIVEEHIMGAMNIMVNIIESAKETIRSA